MRISSFKIRPETKITLTPPLPSPKRTTRLSEGSRAAEVILQLSISAIPKRRSLFPFPNKNTNKLTRWRRPALTSTTPLNLTPVAWRTKTSLECFPNQNRNSLWGVWVLDTPLMRRAREANSQGNAKIGSAETFLWIGMSIGWSLWWAI